MSKISIEPARRALSGPVMGTRWSALLYAPETFDLTALKAELACAVANVDRQMSTWKPDSDLMRVNAAAPGMWVPVPAELMLVLEKGVEIGRASDGAFDIGLGDLVNAWGFGPSGKVADGEAVRCGLGKVRPPTHELLELDSSGRRARKHAPVKLDLSGIAKGFAVDAMAEVVRGFGVGSALVALDGELKATGVRPGGAPWIVAVEKPDYETRAPLGLLALHNAAIATSGDYRHWIEIGRTRLSHTMDRVHGGPVANNVASVSVVCPSCMEADAWATALLVLGPEKGRELAWHNGLHALFVLRSGDSLSQVTVGKVFEEACVA
ncbi:MAG: FAD:protein FMN transferase [Mesorhizobium sp.]